MSTQTHNPDRVFTPKSASADRGVQVGQVGQLATDTLAVALLRRFDAVVVDQTVERAAILEYDAGLSRAAAEAHVCDLYVASDLDSWPAPVLPDLGRTGYAPVVVSDGKEYRRLDAAWYGYLHGQMAKAKALADAGRLPADDWRRLRERFAGVHRFAALKGCAIAPRQAVPV